MRPVNNCAVYDDENRAPAKFYTICAAAALSGIPYHAAFLIYEDGAVMQRIFDRRTPEPSAQNDTRE